MQFRGPDFGKPGFRIRHGPNLFSDPVKKGGKNYDWQTGKAGAFYMGIRHIAYRTDYSDQSGDSEV